MDMAKTAGSSCMYVKIFFQILKTSKQYKENHVNGKPYIITACIKSRGFGLHFMQTAIIVEQERLSMLRHWNRFLYNI